MNDSIPVVFSRFVAFPDVFAEAVDRFAASFRFSRREAKRLRSDPACRTPPGKQRKDPLDSRFAHANPLYVRFKRIGEDPSEQVAV